jgi:hypothetical protein
VWCRIKRVLHDAQWICQHNLSSEQLLVLACGWNVEGVVAAHVACVRFLLAAHASNESTAHAADGTANCTIFQLVSGFAAGWLQA